MRTNHNEMPWGKCSHELSVTQTMRYSSSGIQMTWILHKKEERVIERVISSGVSARDALVLERVKGCHNKGTWTEYAG